MDKLEAWKAVNEEFVLFFDTLSRHIREQQECIHRMDEALRRLGGVLHKIDVVTPVESMEAMDVLRQVAGVKKLYRKKVNMRVQRVGDGLEFPVDYCYFSPEVDAMDDMDSDDEVDDGDPVGEVEPMQELDPTTWENVEVRE